MAVLAALFGLVYAFNLHAYLSFETLSQNREALLAYVEENFVWASAFFFMAYVAVVALSIPGATWMTLGAGFVFGMALAAVYIVFAATLGAVLVFLIARYVAGDAWRRKLGKSVGRLERGFQDNEVSYLLVLRLVPMFPFWLVNIASALLGVGLRNYALTTFFGIIPGTVVYCSVGAGLGAVFDQGGAPDLSIIYAPEIFGPLLGLAVLAMIPVLYNRYRSRHDG